MTSDYPTGEAVARTFFDAWNAGDADGTAALFTPDADFVNVVGLWWTSARQIRKAHDYGFGCIFRGARVQITELNVRELTLTSTSCTQFQRSMVRQV